MFITSADFAVIIFFITSFHSRLQYAIPRWGGTYVMMPKPIEITQEKIIRVMLRKNRMEPSFPLFKRLGIFPLRSLIVSKSQGILFILGVGMYSIA